VTHRIAEAVFLGTRVVVLTAGPARMADNFRLALPEPRTLDIKTGEAFGEYRPRKSEVIGEGPSMLAGKSVSRVAVRTSDRECYFAC
jgi:ABC-type nitrate/sulfonate/bicarbonate transport system ATPase subunit